MNHNRIDQGRRLARQANIPLDGDYFAVIRSDHAANLADIARQVGYRRPKNANGSTSRYFFHYLQKGVKS